jgi:hypothetical protein
MEVSSSDLLWNQLQMIKELTREIIGDTGMWCCLHALLSEGKKMEPDERFANIAKAYNSIIAVAKDAAKGGIINDRLQRSIIHRFAFQGCAVLPPGEEYITLILEALEKANAEIGDNVVDIDSLRLYLNKCAVRKTQFGKKDSLTANLREFSPYGGTKNLNISVFGENTGDRIVEAFRDAWNGDGETSKRLDLLYKLWAASVRFSIPRLFSLHKGNATT